MAKLKMTLTCAKCGRAFTPMFGDVIGFDCLRCVQGESGKQEVRVEHPVMWLCPACSKLMREAFLGYEVEK